MNNLNVCWFRTDLRTCDNRALEAAIKAGPVVALYIATPGQWQSHDDAPVKLDFWRRNLESLEAALEQRGIPLVCCEVGDYAAIPSVLEEIIDRWQISGLYFNREYPLNEWRRDQAVGLLCEELKVQVHAFDDSVLIPPGQILNNSGDAFKVFTPFSRKARQIIGESDTSVRPCPHNGAEVPDLSPLTAGKALSAIGWPEGSRHWRELWPAGEKLAAEKLDNFCKAPIADYRDKRDFPAVDGTSSLSAWLTAGVVSIRQCWQQASAWQKGDGVEAWTGELLWREFYKHVMFHYPRVSVGRPFRQDLDHVTWRDDEEGYQRWCTGKTGIPIVDAGMRQLLDTGWMHNRLRMITAMFLSKHLLIDWRRGESWFMRHLVDGDFSANNGGWQWSASTGTDAAPYFRVFNPVTQSRRFDAEGAFLRRYLPELAGLDNKSIHEPGRLDLQAYPSPMVDLKQARERAIAAFKR